MQCLLSLESCITKQVCIGIPLQYNRCVLLTQGKQSFGLYSHYTQGYPLSCALYNTSVFSNKTGVQLSCRMTSCNVSLELAVFICGVHKNENSLFTNLYVVPNLYGFFPLLNTHTQRKYFLRISCILFPT